MNLPNFITLARLLLVPITVWLIISDAYGLAFIAFVAAGVSDGLDGYLARRLDLRTELGAYLDPVADKALLVSIYLTLGFIRDLPAWLVILVVSRDVLIVGAVILSWLMGRPMKVAPLKISKLNTAAQILFVVAVLGVAALGKSLATLVIYGSIPVGLLTAASGGAYLWTWFRHMAERPPQDRKT